MSCYTIVRYRTDGRCKGYVPDAGGEGSGIDEIVMAQTVVMLVRFSRMGLYTWESRCLVSLVRQLQGLMERE